MQTRTLHDGEAANGEVHVAKCGSPMADRLLMQIAERSGCTCAALFSLVLSNWF